MITDNLLSAYFMPGSVLPALRGNNFQNPHSNIGSNYQNCPHFAYEFSKAGEMKSLA